MFVRCCEGEKEKEAAAEEEAAEEKEEEEEEEELHNNQPPENGLVHHAKCLPLKTPHTIVSPRRLDSPRRLKSVPVHVHSPTKISPFLLYPWR